MNDLLKFYRSLLESMDYRIGKDGCIYAPEYVGEKRKVTVTINKNKKNLVFPSESKLRKMDSETEVAFHPTSEVAIYGVSEVTSKLLKMMAFKLYITAQDLSTALMRVLEMSETTDIPLDLAKIISKVGRYTKTADKYLTSVHNKCTGFSGEYPLFTIRLERGKKLDGVSYNRVSTLSLKVGQDDEMAPIFDLNKATENTISVVRGIYENIFPKTRRFGNNDIDMPYLIALLEAYAHISERFNLLIDKLEKFSNITQSSRDKNMKPLELGKFAKRINLTWTRQVSSENKMSGINLAKLRHEYLPQMLEGNEGTANRNEAQKGTRWLQNYNAMGLSPDGNDLNEPNVQVEDDTVPWEKSDNPGPVHTNPPNSDNWEATSHNHNSGNDQEIDYNAILKGYNRPFR